MSKILLSELGYRSAYTQGGFNHYKKYEDPNEIEAYTDRVGWYGWFGHGGVIMQWHPTLNIAFGYAQTNTRWYDETYAVGGKLQKLVMDCHIASLSTYQQSVVSRKNVRKKYNCDGVTYVCSTRVC